METFSSNKPYLIRALYEWILDNNGTPHLIVNAGTPGTQVPQEHVKNGEIVLNVSPGAVQGLIMDNEHITFNARFSGVARVIYLPMSSILAIIARENGQGMAFPPEEMVEQVEAESEEQIKAVEDPKEQPDPDKPEPPKKKSGRSHLKIVK